MAAVKSARMLCTWVTRARNAQLRQEIELEPVQLGAGNQTDVGLPVLKRLGAITVRSETEIGNALATWPTLEPPRQGPGIQVADGGNDQPSV